MRRYSVGFEQRYTIKPYEISIPQNVFESYKLLRQLMLAISEENCCSEINEILKYEYDKYFGKRYYRNSDVHLIKLRILQIMIFSSCKSLDDAYIAWLMKCLLKEDNEPSINYLLQLLLIQVLLKCNNPMEYITKYDNGSLGMRTSYIIPIVYHVVMNHTFKFNRGANIEGVLNYLIPYTMGQHFKTRFYAQWTIKKIIDEYIELCSSEVINVLKPSLNEILSTTHYVGEDHFFMTHFNMKYDMNVTCIYYEIPRLTHVCQSEWMYENMHKSTLKDIILKHNKEDDELDDECYNNKLTNIQKKIEPGLVKHNLNKTKNKLVLVASLINRVPNLGGLSRTCEVFGVSEYIINNIQNINNKEYKSLSMSSEKWVKTSEIKESNLPEFIEKMKYDGYEIVGAELTHNSQNFLHNFKFHEKTVLILGNENEGIPPKILGLLDRCVEIPQCGQIRSLNVHIAGALIIWEYVKQCST